ncbi:hypothetical protein [Mucilaginibacter sp. dw_454]|uniref:hypothetical protein n=1 Tax=Mucilaginibacter sp. dw_454 TaxID=2720079 RepID=UPI001BD2A51D|nr:hypothetical protein [Mucilaginibacter sp. dw_454]
METNSSFLIKKRLGITSPAITKTTPFAIAVFTIAILLAYHSVFSHQFQMYWDDQWVVFNFYTENGLTTANLHDIFTQFFHGQYSPVNQLTYTLIYAAAGADSFRQRFSAMLARLS